MTFRKGDRFAERAVKDGVPRTGGVIGEDQDIFVREWRGLRTPLPEKRSARDQQRDDRQPIQRPAEACREW